MDNSQDYHQDNSQDNHHELDLAPIIAREAAATRGPWWFNETEQCWVLYGVHAIFEGHGSFPEQVISEQVLKAPKIGTPYAEYWPNAADGDFIVNARTDVKNLINEVLRLRRIVTHYKSTYNIVGYRANDDVHPMDFISALTGFTISELNDLGGLSTGDDTCNNAVNVVDDRDSSSGATQ